ncbi:MAG: hypothetical protein QM754_20255 [Tepidisphaeraceae bacterium]
MSSVLLGIAALTQADPETERTWKVTSPPPTTAPDYSAYTQSYHIPFAPYGKNKVLPDFDKLAGMNVRVSINGGEPMTLQVDTGSWGIVVGDLDVPNIDPNSPEGSLIYSSSGNQFYGKWTMATVTFPDSKDEHGNVATAVVPVLAADTYKHVPGAVNDSKKGYTQSAHPRPRMFGIGSGRGKENNQFRNPWVNLKEMQAGTMRRGYTITRDGITLGLTGKGVGDGYVFEKLKEHVGQPTTWPAVEPRPKDWDSPTGYVVVDGKKQETMWTLLDTGLTNMMIEVPQMHGQATVPDGTPIEVHLLGGRLMYEFKVGDKNNPATPSKVTWVHYDSPPMINTGLRALAHFDYLYDADGGYFGLRPTRPATTQP